jgi:hypothetical protein
MFILIMKIFDNEIVIVKITKHYETCNKQKRSKRGITELGTR